MTLEYLPAQTYHRRIGGQENSFRYSVDFFIWEPEEDAADWPALISRDGRNLASLQTRDHGGPRGDGRGAAWVRDVLKAEGLPEFADMRVRLVSQSRMLGMVFNPVSFWLVTDDTGALRAVIAEVNNTFGDRHSYLCVKSDRSPIGPEDRIEAQKIFHVSPFQPVAGRYRFKFDVTDGHFAVRIDYRNGNGGLLATLAGERRPARSRDILVSLVRRPVGAVRVLALIHWHALVLKLRGARFHSRPVPPAQEVSR
ncbi:DUF1365 domain-containing protein [Oceanomicrobium pacificus]|uniref:DUF1365 family protein n=1 Tax=Oceanomicrobium pacificus TaxID=2692916 RepID=A0A6B0TYX1_9RHOB|nr:DUF1365 domain-containing protein [Oceanomicrobium pacificus]MXU66213.1 DUF1365 family protein [Oceanomicrobium pacificus]